jgi:CheY-like chemotaxis protein
MKCSIPSASASIATQRDEYYEKEMMKTERQLLILYMEDDSGHAALLKSTLNKAGHIVHIAQDGREGQEMLSKVFYDVVIIDHNMPLMSGLDVVKQLKEKGPLPPIIMLTGAGNEEIAVQAMKLGIGDYIVKDYEGDYLQKIGKTIESVLENQRRDAENRKAMEDRENLILELKEALERVKKLSGLLHICANCKRIKDDRGAWNQMERYISYYTDLEFSHSICPECAEVLYPEYSNRYKERKSKK